MISESIGPTTPRKWTWARWIAAIAIVFTVHVALIWIFGSHKRAQAVPVRNTLSLSLVKDSPPAWLALNNAALFALPANNGFAASMWTELPPLTLHKQEWTEEPHWLSRTNLLLATGLGAELNRFLETNRFASIHFEFTLPPQVAVPATPTEPPFVRHSILQIGGELAGRRLLSSINLPSWQMTDVAAQSIVQVLVDAAGNVVSAVLLKQEFMSPESSWEPPLTRNRDADRWAVDIARTLRFAPLPSIPPGPTDLASHLAIGQLIFDWQTVPVTTTNAAQ